MGYLLNPERNRIGQMLENGSGNRQNACLSGAAPDGRVPFTVLSLPFLEKMCYDTLRV